MVSPYEKKSLGKKKSLGQDKYFPLIIGENFLKNPDFGRIRIAQIKPLNDKFLTNLGVKIQILGFLPLKNNQF